MFKEDNWCVEPAIGLGFVELTPYFHEGHHRYPDSVRDLKAASEWCKNMPHLEYGRYRGIVSAPVHKCNFMPDLITMHVTGMQTTKLLTGPESVKAMKRARAAAQSYPTPKGK